MDTDRIINVVSLIFGIVGIIVGAVMAVRQRRAGPAPARLYFRASEYPLAFPIAPDTGLALTFEGRPVREARRILIEMWNDGGATVDSSSFTVDDPLRFSLPEGSRILRPTVIAQSRTANGVTVEDVQADRPNEVAFSFSYLDPSHGARIHLLYERPEADLDSSTGPFLLLMDPYVDDAMNLHIDGTIKGVPRGFQRYTSGRSIRNTMGWVFLSLFGGSALSTIGALNLPAPWAPICFIGTMFFCFCFAMYMLNRKEKGPKLEPARRLRQLLP